MGTVFKFGNCVGMTYRVEIIIFIIVRAVIIGLSLGIAIPHHNFLSVPEMQTKMKVIASSFRLKGHVDKQVGVL